ASSIFCNICSAYSNTVTSTPKSASKDAHSTPITPPPIIRTEEGKLSHSKEWSEVTILTPSGTNPGRALGRDPVAISTYLGTSIVFSLPSSYSTEIVPGNGEKMLGPKIRPNP